MRQLAETNCEILDVINFKLPSWKSSDSQSQEDTGLFESSKESGLSQTCGGFLSNDCTYSWLSHGSRLIVQNMKSGQCIATLTLPDKITTVSPFPARMGCVPLLLIGLDNNAIRIKDSVGHLYIFDCVSSSILAIIQVPAGVEKACVIHGGEDWEEFNEKRPDTVLAKNSGLIFAALRNLQHVIIDINRDLWSRACYKGEEITATLEFVNVNPLSAMQNPKSNKIEPTHLAYDLMDKEIEQYIGFDRQDFEATPLYDENLCSVLLSSTKTGCLITGCLGRVIIWQNDGTVGWISPTFDENAYVTHIALLEPSDDPKPFYYLWIVCQSDAPDSAAVLRMYMLMFKNKHNDKSSDGSSLYFNLESEPSLKFELELEQGERVHSLLAIERENSRDASDMSSRRGEESLLLIGTEERVLLFDLNRWYKEQMPCTMAGCRNPNSVMASYRTRQDDTPRKGIISCCYVAKSLREFPNKGPHSPEELFFPNSLNLEWVDLFEDKLVLWLTRGVQSELLREITMAGPIVLVMPTETYRRCLNAGLVPFDSTPQDYSFEVEQTTAREMLLSLCLEQRWTHLLLRCATEWSDGSAAYLYPEFLRWGVQRASEIKLMTDRLCVPLFDLSGANIGESEVRTLRYCAQQLECLATVVSRLPNPEADLSKHRRALKRITTYLQVLLWFYDVGLLPETQEVDEDDDVPMSPSIKIPYPRNKLIESYKRKRRNDCNEENKEDNILFIDQLITRDCVPLKVQWEKESDSDCPNQGGLYPPPSLQSLLRSFLTDCHCEEQNEEEEENWELPETASKHCIVIYLLMDLAMLLEGTNSAVDRLITYPAAFKLSPSLIKLTQAFWLLDHENYDGFFKIMMGQFVTNVDIKDWQHKLAINALLKNDQHKLALIYLKVIKPPLSSLDDQSMMIDLAVEQGHIESAFHARSASHHGQLLMRFFHACKNSGKLKKILHLSLDPEEEEVFIKYLKDNDNEETRLIYYLQRGRHTEASDIFSINTNIHPRQTTPEQMKIQPSALHLLKAFNNTLPDITKRFASSLDKSIIPPPNGRPFVPFSMMRNGNEPRGFYPKPMSQTRDKVSGIYELAIQKTRETCLRPDRGGPGTSNYVPFLAAPYTTINFGPKFAGQTNEQGDVNCVTYPERKVMVSKRTLKMASGGEDNVDNGIENKRRKLHSDLSNSDSDPHKFRRLSMSQVCNTPLIKRKEAGEPNGLVSETPHSILKIRQQLLRRNSRSPSYNYGQGDASDGEDVLKSSVGSELKPLRQIRFSVDRLSGNDDSGLSANETQNEGDQSGSSKNTAEESCTEENYYSPNVTGKSLRDNTILSDTSVSRCFAGPRPRPCLRRSGSFNSRESSEEPSRQNSSLNNSTMNESEHDMSGECKRTPRTSIIARRRSAVTPSFHCASILSNDTSFETSPLKKPFTVYNNEQNDDNETEESESEDATNVISNFNKTEFDKTEEEKEDNQDDYAMEVDEEYERPLSENILNDDDENIERQQMQKPEEETEDSEDDTNETFQSISDSFNDSKVKTMENITGLQDNTSQLENPQRARDYLFTEQSLTDNILNVQKEESGNYSLTKPIFINSQGIVGFQQEYNITDDESVDEGAIVQPSIRLTLCDEEIEKDEEADLVLSFSNSDDENRENKNEQQNIEKKNTSVTPIAYISGSKTENSDSRKKRSTSVTKEVKKILAEVIKTPVIPKINIEEATSPSEEDESVDDPNKLTPIKNPFLESTEDDEDEQPIKENKPNKSATEQLIQDSKKERKSSESSEPGSEKSTKKRARRAGSTVKETSLKTKSEKPSRKTRAASITKENVEATSIQETVEEQIEAKSPTRSRSTRASSMAKDTSTITSKKIRDGSVAKDNAQSAVITRKTRAGSVIVDDDLPSAHTRSKTVESVTKDDEESVTTTRRTRAGSVANDEDKANTTRKTRAGSVIKEDDRLTNKETRKTRSGSVAKEEEKLIPRKTRASSLAKEAKEEEAKVLTPERRSTRASSIAKDNVPEEQDEVGKKPGRKRGNSVSKEVPSIIELNRRGRRSTSLLKEVILEESASLIESPASAKRTRGSRINEPLPSSPAANTRSRRSSIQSVPDELEEILNVPSTLKSKNVPVKEETSGRGRRATSVDSAVIVPAGKRVTRSVLAKSSIIEEVIPEESMPMATKKQPARRKRATSVSGNEVEEVKAKTLGKPKRGRKASESKDYQFSLPEEAGDAPASTEEACRTPTFEFSEPTGLQKFITPIRYDEESFNETTNVLKKDVDNEKNNLAKIQRRPRSYFVMPKKTKDKAK